MHQWGGQKWWNTCKLHLHSKEHEVDKESYISLHWRSCAELVSFEKEIKEHKALSEIQDGGNFFTVSFRWFWCGLIACQDTIFLSSCHQPVWSRVHRKDVFMVEQRRTDTSVETLCCTIFSAIPYTGWPHRSLNVFKQYQERQPLK